MILQSDNPIRMVRELKGAGLSIVIALGLVNQRVSQEWLERATGYTDKTVSQALQYLEENGLADHTGSGWQLSSNKARQLVMPLELEDENPPEPEQDCANEIIDHDQDENIAESRNNSDSLTTTILNNIDVIDSVVVDSSNDAKKRKNSDFEANLEEFKLFGIGKNKRTEALARMEHINPQYIRAHLKALKKKDSKGLAIMRMEQGEEAPESSHEITDDEKRSKYREWEQS